jgi:hypothetical protein
MTHIGANSAYEVTLGPAAIRTIQTLPDPDDRTDLGFALRTELVAGPNADKEIRLDSKGRRLSGETADSADMVYTATPLSIQAYTAVHRPMTKDEIDRLREEQGRSTYDCGLYVVDILPARAGIHSQTRWPG